MVVMSVWSLNFSGQISAVYDAYLALRVGKWKVTAAKSIQQSLRRATWMSQEVRIKG